MQPVAEAAAAGGAATVKQGIKMIKEGNKELVHDLGVALTGGKKFERAGYLEV